MKKFLWLFVAVPSVILAEDISLHFDPSGPTKGTSVVFAAERVGMVPLSSIAHLPLRTQGTRAELYSLSIDTQTFGRDKYQRFSFDAYVRTLRSGGTPEVYKYVVSEDPVGPFEDCVFGATFHIRGPAGEDTGSILLPLHSVDGSDNLSLDIPKAPLKVGLSGASNSTLGLSNKLESLHVQAISWQISSATCSECWLNLSAEPGITRLAPQKGTSLKITRRPDTFRAFTRSMFALNPAEPHDVLVISVSSLSEQGGLQTSQEFKVPVRFAPSPLYLIVAVVVGSLIGGLLRLSVRDSAPAESAAPGKRKTLKDLGFSMLIATAVWAFALMLFSYTPTSVVVLGFSFDPSQVIPAGLIAFLAAGGPPVITRMKEAFGK